MTLPRTKKENFQNQDLGPSFFQDTSGPHALSIAFSSRVILSTASYSQRDEGKSLLCFGCCYSVGSKGSLVGLMEALHLLCDTDTISRTLLQLHATLSCSVIQLGIVLVDRCHMWPWPLQKNVEMLLFGFLVPVCRWFELERLYLAGWQKGGGRHSLCFWTTLTYFCNCDTQLNDRYKIIHILKKL